MVMSRVSCRLGFHSWNGCRCSKCDKKRNEFHDWRADCERCASCEQTRQNAHTLNGCKCSACGQQRHDWAGDDVKFGSDFKCNRCSATRLQLLLDVISNKIGSDTDRAEATGEIIFMGSAGVKWLIECLPNAWAACALGEIGDERAIPALVTILINDHGMENSLNAGSALVAIGDAVAEPLERELKRWRERDPTECAVFGRYGGAALEQIEGRRPKNPAQEKIILYTVFNDAFSNDAKLNPTGGMVFGSRLLLGMGLSRLLFPYWSKSASVGRMS